MKRRITWEEYVGLLPGSIIDISGLKAYKSHRAFEFHLSPAKGDYFLCKPIFDLLTVEADIPEPEPEHPPIPEGWELCTKETYRGMGRQAAYKDPELVDKWFMLHNDDNGWNPCGDKYFYIQPIEPRAELRRFGSWEELQDYWLRGHSAVLNNGKPARLLNVERGRIVVQTKTTRESGGSWELFAGDLAYPEGFNG